MSWIHANETALWWLATGSGLAFVATLLLVPVILIRLPSDYFSHRRRRDTHAAERHPLIRLLFALVKNALGVVFIAAGIAMLVLPGQGVLTIVVGLMLLDFPGKYHAEQWAVGHRSVLRTINWIRRRAHKPPMTVEPTSARM